MGKMSDRLYRIEIARRENLAMRRLPLPLAISAVLTALCQAPATWANDEATAAAVAAASSRQQAATPAKPAKVARMTLRGALNDAPSPEGLFGELADNLADMINRLDKAGEDESLQAVLLRIRTPGIGYGGAQELRGAIRRLQDSGKRVYAQMEQAHTMGYLVASACHEIIMPPAGTVTLPGVRAEMTYYKGLLDKLGIEADFIHVGEAKGAAEPYTRTKMSPGVRENMTQLVDDLYEQVVATIAADRKLTHDKVRAILDDGLLTASQAQAQGLIDRVAYADELEGLLQQRLDVASVRMVKRYGKREIDDDFSGPMGMFKLMQALMGIRPSSSSRGGNKIAIVYATGPITTGSSTSTLFGDSVMGADTIVAALRKANEESKVKAIVLRINSPGGSALASDLIWRETVNIDKPVIASMGDVAASGGYYIAMGCDQIFAEPSTVTGSIGVVGGKLVMRGLNDKVGITTDVIQRGKNSGIFGTSGRFSDSERAVVATMMQDIYEQFTRKAASGRDIELAELEKLAGGRVYSGTRAQRLGLVDHVGTLHQAIAAAQRAAGLSEEDRVETLVLPKPMNFFDALLDPNADDEISWPADIFSRQAIGLARPLEFVSVWKPLREVAILREVFQTPSALLLPYRLELR